MTQNVKIVELIRDIVSDALFNTQYSLLSNEWDFFLTNILVSFVIFVTLFLLYKALAFVFSLYGG